MIIFFREYYNSIFNYTLKRDVDSKKCNTNFISPFVELSNCRIRFCLMFSITVDLELRFKFIDISLSKYVKINLITKWKRVWNRDMELIMIMSLYRILDCGDKFPDHILRMQPLCDILDRTQATGKKKKKNKKKREEITWYSIQYFI